MAAVIEEHLRPFLLDIQLINPNVDYKLTVASKISSFICQVGMPYAFLQHAISLHSPLSGRTKRLFALLALIPLLLMVYITPIVPELQFNFVILFLWAGPYIIGASLLLMYNMWREKDPVMKRTRLLSNILTVIPMIFLLFSIYIARIFGYTELWRYNLVIIIIQFIAFIAFSIKYSVLGVKLRFESYRLDSTIRAISSGSTILNHTIKNEVGKIRMFATRIQEYASEEKTEEMKEDIKILLQSTDHMLNMVNRIQEHSQEIILKEEPILVHELINETLHKLYPFLQKKQVQIEKNVPEPVQLICDPVHIQEVIGNIVTNAAEAMQNGGTIHISQYESKRQIILAFEDTGAGISKENLPYVLDPFFSTKKTASNFGLGLSYCYNVMKKHGGSLEIQSEKNVGTTVYLYFPKRKLVHPD